MERVIRLMLLAAAVGFTVQTARPHFRYGDWLDPSWTFEILGVSIPFGIRAIMVLLHVGKVSMPAAAAMFWSRSQYICWALALLLFPALVAVSITGTFGFLDLQRTERATGEATTQRREADLRAELAATGARLQKIGWWRAAAIVESGIAAERRNPLWAGSDSCSNAATRQQQRYCKMHDRLTGELVAAREAEDDRRREKEIRAELLRIKVTSSSPRPDLDFLSRALEVSLERAGFWRTILFAAAIEAGEALFLLLGTASMPHGLRCDRNHRIAMRLRSVCWRALEWIKCKLRRQGNNSPPPSRETAVRPQRQHIPRSAPVRAPPEPKRIGRVQVQTFSSFRRDADLARPSSPLTPEEAVDAFVAECSRRPEARVAGKAMCAAYDRLRLVRGWPRLSPAAFGRHLKPAVEAAGGRKVKASAQIYIGLALPPG